MAQSVEAFREEAAAFLAAHAVALPERSLGWGVGPDEVFVYGTGMHDDEEHRAANAAAQCWQATLYDGGFGWIDGPCSYGGRGLSREHVRAFRELEARYEVPDLSSLMPGMVFIGPTIAAYGEEDVKRTLLPRIYRGDVIMCQLYSESEAGSDLGAISTRATRRDDGWLISGQKIWTSSAQYAHMGQCLARTGPKSSRHRGLTMFIVDMHAPGVEVRPIRQITGGAEFNEVTFTDVFVPDDHRLGDVDGGWAVMLATLANERSGMADALVADEQMLERVIRLAEHLQIDDQSDIRARIARIHTRLRGVRAVMKELDRRPESTGAELVMAKLTFTRTLRELSTLVADMLGPAIAIDNGAWGTFAWSRYLLGVLGLRLGGGADDILMTTIAERHLGMPRASR